MESGDQAAAPGRAARDIQRVFRGNLARQGMRQQQSAVTLAQAHFRGHMARALRADAGEAAWVPMRRRVEFGMVDLR